MSGIHWPGVLTVAGLYAVFLVIGWLAARKAQNGSATDLILAGRALPLWLAIMTMTATWVDGGYLNGTAEAAYDPSRGLARAVQTGLCFGVSLILGGLLFAKTMRRREFTTLVDPFEDRFGQRWSAVLVLPALFGETVWCGALLVALGSTFTVLLGISKELSYILSAAIVTAYTMEGGMWSVAWTDACQLLLIPLGLLAALPFVLAQSGGLHESLSRPLLPGQSTSPVVDMIAYIDASLVLILGGIPWNCYFQRVLSCRTPGRAAAHSILAGLLTIVLVFPPLLLGMGAVGIFKGADHSAAETLPRLLLIVPPAIGLLGLAAIVGAVTSSYSASILSAGSLLAWNVYRPLVAPTTSVGGLKLVIRFSILGVSLLATLLALRVGSVFDLWTFTADLVFVLLFPQLVCALFDRHTNRIGSITAFVVSLTLRLGGGEKLFGIEPFLPYADLVTSGLANGPEIWYDRQTGALLFPFRSLAALAGLILLPVVSRWTARWDPPRLLRAAPSEATRP